ncbi:MAG TPA: hypothetical protein VH062_02430 [Polyangiaceae bacterium]|jgi:hypothetical protein|nr:hypothetical protein [Polyangiaceae bacterium]
MTAAEIEALLADQRFPSSTEARLQLAIADHLTAAGVAFQREHRFSAEDRVDFFVDGGVALEVKTKGSATEVARQLMRYAQHDAVRELLLVTSRMQLACVPRELNGKPVRVSIQWSGL